MRLSKEWTNYKKTNVEAKYNKLLLLKWLIVCKNVYFYGCYKCAYQYTLNCLWRMCTCASMHPLCILAYMCPFKSSAILCSMCVKKISFNCIYALIMLLSYEAYTCAHMHTLTLKTTLFWVCACVNMCGWICLFWKKMHAWKWVNV